jgi:hypothetical protein
MIAMPNEPQEASSGGRTGLVPVSRFGRLLLVVAVVHSSAETGFYVDLPVGRYVVEPRSTGAASFDHAAPFSIRIARGAWCSVTVMFDTGLR